MPDSVADQLPEEATASVEAAFGNVSPRIARLKHAAVNWHNEPDPTERGWAIMRAFDRHADDAPAIRLTEGVAEYLRTQTLTLDDGDLLAGRIRRTLKVHRGIHEGYEWVNAAMFPECWSRSNCLERSPVSQEFRRALTEWHQRHPSRTRGLTVPEDVRQAMATGAFAAHGLEGGHRLPRSQMLLEHGAENLLKKAESKLVDSCVHSPETTAEQAFYRSQVIVYQSMIDYGRRWADALERWAQDTQDTERRQELHDLVAVCRRVPSKPARTFWEALQSIWFCILINDSECPGTATSIGRLDQLLWPFYVSDLAAGRMTRDRALELIECLFLKCYRTFDFHHTTVGGLNPDGTDGTNELSYLCLEAVQALRTPRDLAVRIHHETPRPFLRRAVEVAALGLGRPDFWNDEVTVPALLNSGFSLEDARDYAPIGCVELTIPGKCNSRTMGHAMNLAKILELTLNGGRCPHTGVQVGQEHESEFATFEDLHAAYRERAAFCIRLALEQNARDYQYQAEHLPFPVLSACTEGCLGSGRDVMNGGAIYNPAGVNLFGVANVADALAALRRLVFEEKQISLSSLRQALGADFEDHEDLRQQLITRAPKFGNDDAEVDEIAAQETAFYCREVRRVRTAEGGPHLPLIFGTSPQAVFHLGRLTGALPDGRRAGEPLAMSCNPANGRNTSGLTSELASVARLDFSLTSGGVSYIIDLYPGVIDSASNLERLTDALQTFFRQGGMEIGINVLRDEQLREAQQDPDRYAHIMVRVFGFSSQFVSLEPALQEYVISKCRHQS